MYKANSLEYQCFLFQKPEGMCDMARGFKLNTVNNVCFLTIPSFEKHRGIAHGFTTRIGGVSPPPFNSMNLGFSRGDDTENVKKNYEIAGDALGMDLSDMVAFRQVHENNIYIATKKDKGIGFSENRSEYDGIITAEENLPIATFHADCVPVFLFDPVRRVVGVVHAGWRGTVKRVVVNAIDKMTSDFGCSPADILAGIGPCIRDCCYEVGNEVIEKARGLTEIDISDCVSVKNNKYHIDIAEINRKLLIHFGLLPENITLCNQCTCCNDEIFWSHRKTNGIRGCMAAIIMLY